MKKQRHIEIHENESIAHVLIRFCIPLIMSGILHQLYNWADAFIVGNLEGELALAAINCTNSIIKFYLLALGGFTAGLSILIAQRYGAQRNDEIPRILGTFSTIIGGAFLAVAIVGALSARTVLELMDTTPETIDMSTTYLRIIFAGFPFLAVYNIHGAALRAIGNSRAPFAAMLVSSAANIIMDLVLVGVFKRGVAGAAEATVFSQAAMTVYIVIYSRKKYPLLRFMPGRNSFDKESFKEGVKYGLPVMLQSSIRSFGGILLQNFMNGFGTTTVAAITTAYKVDGIIMLPLTNLGTGISTLSAQFVGAGDKKKARKVFAVGAALEIITSVVLTVFVILFGGNVIAMFGVGENSIATGVHFFRSIAVFYWVFGLSTALRGHLEGSGDLIFSSSASVITLAVRLFCSYAFAGVFGEMVIAYAEVISWAVMAALYASRLVLHKKRDEKENLTANEE